MGSKLNAGGGQTQFDLFSAVDPKAPAPVLIDAGARAQIATELDRNVVVLAGAGAGKTHELIGRMVATVASGGAAVEQLAAITFTRKAAGEMKNRFARRLTAELDQLRRERSGLKGEQRKDVDTVIDRLAAALDRVDQCFIGTIHAFCARLLRECPLEAGLPPDFYELDERQEASAQREAWDAFVEHLYERSDPVMAAFLDTGIALEDLFPFFQTRVQYAEVRLRPAAIERPDLSEVVEAGKTFVNEYADQVPFHANPDNAGKTIQRAAAFLRNRGISSQVDDIDFVQLLFHGLGGKSVTLNRWPGKDGLARKLRDDLIPQLVDTITPVMRQWNEYVYAVAAPLIDKALEFYRNYRRERSQVTFQDLLELTVKVLKDRPSVRRQFQAKLRRLYVDEFQDTDPLQAEMLLLLTSENASETDWRQCVPKPGTLFIVGDEKQSIYRFRRADIDTFRRVVDIIRDNGGLVVELTTSFRSLGNLCQQLNRVYKPLFDQGDPEYQARFAPLSPNLLNGADPFCVRRLTFESTGRRDDKAEAEAEKIADFIRAAIDGRTNLNGSSEDSILRDPVSPGSFMLISRQRRRLSTYAQALERQGIPYDLTGGDSLGALPELRLLVQFLEVILYPDDKVRYFAYLRGPLVGLSDRELYSYRQNGGRFGYQQRDLPDGLSDELALKIATARRLILMAEIDLKQLSAGAAIDRVLDRLGLLPFAASRVGGSYSAGSLFRVLSFVRMWDAEGLSWVEIVKQFNDLIADDVKAIEGMTLDVGRPDVVRVLNLHQAKGLEADVVFLVDAADTERSPQNNTVHISRVDDEPFVSIPIYKSLGRGRRLIGSPPGWEEDDAEEAQYQVAEQTRLTYVAATRAARLLVVGDAQATGKTKYIWGDLSTGFADVPELQIPERVEIDPPDRSPEPLAIQVQQRDRALQSARRPSYTVSQVSRHDGIFGVEEADVHAPDSDADVLPGFTRGGFGMEYGTIVHRILELVVEQEMREDDAYLAALFDSFEGSVSAREKAQAAAVDAIRRFRSSGLYQEIASATERYTEVPFGATGDMPGQADGIESVITSGVIDLVYRVDGAWHIVDYKTDGADRPEDVAVIKNRYSEQVRTYARFWASIVQEPVYAAGLWITARAELVPVDLE